MYELKMKICHKSGSKMKEGKKKKFVVVNFVKKQQNWLTGFAPKLNILISFEMSSLKLGSFALSLTLNFHICTHLTLKTKPGCANCPTPHPPQFRWFVPSSMKLMWTENNDFVRALVLLLLYISPSHIKYWTYSYHISSTNNNILV